MSNGINKQIIQTGGGGGGNFGTGKRARGNTKGSGRDKKRT